MIAAAPQPPRLTRALRWLLGCAAALTVGGGGGCAHGAPGKPLAAGRAVDVPQSGRSRVIVIVMENAEYGEVIGNFRAPFVNALAQRYGLMTDSFAITHPSLPNYLALTSGSTAGIHSDCTGCAVS